MSGFLESCRSQTNSLFQNRNELSIIMFHDTVSFYNGTIETGTVPKFIPFNESQVRKLLTDNKKEFGDSLIVHLKLTNKIRFLDQAELVVGIIRKENIKTAPSPLSSKEKQL